MKEKINIIIVEDDDNQQDSYLTVVDLYNLEDNPYEFVLYQEKNDDNIYRFIFEGRIDAIIIDIDWGEYGGPDSGNKLMKSIYEESRIPIFMLSGNLNRLTEDPEESVIFKKYNRDVSFRGVIDEIVNIFKTGYTKGLGNKSELDKIITELFWTHLAPTLTEWGNTNAKNSRILRYAITRVNEVLQYTHEHEFDEYDPLEVYILPVISPDYYTSDILEHKSTHKHVIVMTPACDIVRIDNSDFVHICEIDKEPLNSLLTNPGDPNALSNSKKNQWEKFTNNKDLNTHFLPPTAVYQGGLILYDTFKELRWSELNTDYKLIASINPVFSKDIQARFARKYVMEAKEMTDYVPEAKELTERAEHFGRLGQPDLDLLSMIEAIVRIR